MPVFVIPAFNEEANVPRLLADLERRPALWRGGRVVLVDDGSTDRTVEVARAHRGDMPVEVLVQAQNQGPGRAFDRGFRHALASPAPDGLIVTMESDTTSDLDALEGMIAAAQQGADVVLASHHDGGELMNVSRHRRFLSQGRLLCDPPQRGAGRPHGLVVLPRLPRGRARAGLRRVRRRADPRARLRLQGGDPDEARAARDHGSRGPRRRSTGPAARARAR